MFGLPLSTFLLVFAFPVVWIIYTLVFLRVSRSWNDDGENSGEES